MLTCALEIAMLIWGIVIMVTGKLKVSKTKEVRGMAARGLAVLLILPLPLIFLAGVIYGLMVAGSGKPADPLVLTGIEVGILLFCAVGAGVGGMILGKEPRSTVSGFPVEGQVPPPPMPPQGPA